MSEITRKNFIKGAATVAGAAILGAAGIASASADSGVDADALQQLLDIEEIKKVKSRYFRLMDYKNWDELMDVFHPDFRYEMIDPEQGRTALLEEPGREKYIEALKAALDQSTTTHHGHMMEVNLIDGENAECFTALNDVVDLYKWGISQEGWAHYYETYKKCEDGKWRIYRMSIRYIRVKRTPLEGEWKPNPDFEAMSTIFD